MRLRGPDLIGPGLLAVASITLAWQALATAHTVTIGGGIQIKEAVLPNEQLAAAALLAALAAVATAHLIPTAILHATTHPDPRQAADAHRLTRQSYLAAGLAAMAAATLYGLAAGAYFGLSTNPWLPWTVWWTLPAATSLAATGLLTTRLPTHTLPGWIHHTRPPLIPALAAAGGILLMRLSLAVTVPNTIHGLVHLSGNLGAELAALPHDPHVPPARVLPCPPHDQVDGRVAGTTAYISLTLLVVGHSHLCCRCPRMRPSGRWVGRSS